MTRTLQLRSEVHLSLKRLSAPKFELQSRQILLLGTIGWPKHSGTTQKSCMSGMESFPSTGPASPVAPNALTVLTGPSCHRRAPISLSLYVLCFVSLHFAALFYCMGRITLTAEYTRSQHARQQ